MSFPVAVQSAIFYFIACTPCTSARTRYRAKKKFEKERKERAELEAEQPNLYRHPSPFSMNPYWAEEVQMGPSLPKKGRNKPQSQHKLVSAGRDSSVATQSSLAMTSAPNTAMGEAPVVAATPLASATTPATHNQTGAPPPSRNATVPAIAIPPPAKTPTTVGATLPTPSPTLIPDDARSMSLLEPTATATTSIDGWNHRRYQREDEELWGSEPSRTHKFMDAIVKAGSSAGRLLGKERNVTEEDRARFYAPTMIFPPVNDYHPPVVSNKPAGKGALLWMLQPPPPAKVMEGKVPVSRSTSVASSLNAMGAGRRFTAGTESDVSLSRRMAREARMRHQGNEPSANGMASNSNNTNRGTKLSSHSSMEELAARGASRRSTGTSGDARPNSRRKNSLQTMRNRSDSFASSFDDAGWSSDEYPGTLKTRWRFPNTVPAAVAEDLSANDAKDARAAKEAKEAKAGDGAKALTTNAENGSSAATTASQPRAQRAKMEKLETIRSTDVMDRVSEHQEPESAVAQASAGQASKATTTAGKENARMASASMDSGLALSS